MILLENVEVPAHRTQRLALDNWTFTSVRTGCIRVQKGDFTSYIPVGIKGQITLAKFIEDHIARTLSAQSQHKIKDGT